MRMPVSPRYRPDPRHAALGSDFFDPVAPAAFPKATLRFRNDRAAATVGLADLTDMEWVEHFCRFTPLPDNLPEPLALRYHGHQFRHYNPDLGDGRGFLYAQLREEETDRLLDLSTKGSGRTPWSRSGDGRLTLKGGVREVLATEMLEALGVLTSRSFSLIETGEDLERHDEPSPTRSAVLTRLSWSHLRIGSFQRLAAFENTAALKRLSAYAIAEYYPESASADIPVADLFDRVASAVARLGAQWTAAGFVHGVLNTDNIVLTGESFDYGPWRFLPVFEPGFTAAYFDHGGLYAFGRQFEALGWNMARLAECLLPFAPVETLQTSLNAFHARGLEETAAAVHRRLFLEPGDDAEARQRVTLLFTALRESGAPFEHAFFDLVGGGDPARLAASAIADRYHGAAWDAALTALRAATPAVPRETLFAHPYAQRAEPCAMLIDEVERIWARIDEDDDWNAFHAKIDDIREMGAFYRLL